MPIVWTDNLAEFVRVRAGDGASARQIADELGAKGIPVSRNAVIGKCHRSKIEISSGAAGKRLTPSVAKPAARSPRRRRVKLVAVGDGSSVTVPQRAPVMRFFETRSSNPIPIGELEKATCRWPMGGFADLPPYLYCGDPTMEDCAYCARHFRLSIQGTKETNNVRNEHGGAAAQGHPALHSQSHP